MEPIKIVGFDQLDRKNIELAVSQVVAKNPEPFIKTYVDDPRSMGGRYIAADLFKEMFDVFADSKESRNRFNAPVHNSAAVLSSELFARTLAKQDEIQNTVIFLTGIPGAGKTSSVLVGGSLPDDCRLVFEGQMSTYETSVAKIEKVIDAGLKPVIMAVHARPENALENTLKRYNEEGRGASINVMSNIQGALPDTLLALKDRFRDHLELTVVDYRDRNKPALHQGWDNLELLKSEGNQHEIKQRLSNKLDELRDGITDDAYRQARGLAPLNRDERQRLESGAKAMDGSNHAKHDKDDHGRSLPLERWKVGELTVYPAQDDRAYKGPLVAVDREHVIQQISPKVGVAHQEKHFHPNVRSDKNLVQQKLTVSVAYKDGRVLISPAAGVEREKTKNLGR